AVTDPSTRPEITASWVTTSPMTNPSRPITTALPARTVPCTAPSILRVPSVSQSPTTFMPGPMREITDSGGLPWLLRSRDMRRAPVVLEFWGPPNVVRSAFGTSPRGAGRGSGRLLDHRERVHRLSLHQDLEVEVRARGASRGSGEGDDLPLPDRLTELHEADRGMAVEGRVPGAVIDHDVPAVHGVLAHVGHHAATGRPDVRAGRHRHVEPGMATLDTVVEPLRDEAALGEGPHRGGGRSRAPGLRARRTPGRGGGREPGIGGRRRVARAEHHAELLVLVLDVLEPLHQGHEALAVAHHLRDLPLESRGARSARREVPPASRHQGEAHPEQPRQEREGPEAPVREMKGTAVAAAVRHEDDRQPALLPGGRPHSTTSRAERPVTSSNTRSKSASSWK